MIFTTNSSAYYKNNITFILIEKGKVERTQCKCERKKSTDRRLKEKFKALTERKAAIDEE